MFTAGLLAAALLAFSASVNASAAQVTIWSEENCQGDAGVLSIDVSPNYCFDDSPGASWSDLQFNNCNGYGLLSTWSGDNCAGSSTRTMTATDNCNNVPFGSIQLDCQDEA